MADNLIMVFPYCLDTRPPPQLTMILFSCAGTTENHTGDEQQRGREKLATSLSLPKNRSTGNLNLVSARESPKQDRSRVRMSLDASAAAAVAADLEAITRCVEWNHVSLSPGVAADLSPFRFPLTTLPTPGPPS